MYLKKTVKAGLCIFTYRHYAFRYGKKSLRSKNHSETTPKQKEINRRISEDKKIWTLLENFQKGDLWVQFDYRADTRPGDMEAAFKNIQKLLHRAARILKRQEIRLTYMQMTERGVLGGLHHHIVFKNNFDPSILIPLWEHGKVIIDRIYSDNLIKLANYFVKGRSERGEKKYSQSRNLKSPRIKVEIMKSDRWSKDPKPSKGYIIHDLYNGYHEVTGYEYQRCVQKKIE